MVYTLIKSFMNNQNQKGYIALISVVFISSLLVLIVVSFNLISITEIGISLREVQTTESFYLAQACAEEALIKLKENVDYTGGEALEIEDGSCDIVSVEGEGNYNRTIKVSSSFHNMTRRIKVEIAEVNPQTKINSWEEVESF